jgi:predicted component of type VI protein secretion system
MPVSRHTLESLLRRAETMDEEAFAAAHPGLFLLAMGRLSAAEQRAVDEDSTQPVTLGTSHDLERNHPLAGQVFQLTHQRKRLVVGRGDGCDVVVPDDSVSDQHCMLEVRDRELLVVDLGSTNGTAINGQRISAKSPQTAIDGDLLSVARYSFELVAAPALRSMLLAIRSEPPVTDEDSGS